MADVRFVAQLHAAECGAACLTMVLASFGRSIPLSEARDACAIGRDGASAGAIAEAASRFDLDVEAYRLGVDDLGQIAVPAILHWNRSHFVVLAEMTAEGAKIVDPTCGARFVPLSKLRHSFSGVALCLTPRSTFRRGGHRRRGSPVLRRIVRQAAQAMWPLMVAAIFSEVVGFAFPAALPFCVDYVLPAARLPWLIGLVLALGATMLVQGALAIARSRIIDRLRVDLELRIASSLVRRFLRLDRGYVLGRGSAYVPATLAQVSELRDVVSQALLGGFDVLLVVAYSALLLAYSTRLAPVVFFTLGARLAATVWMRRKVTQTEGEVLAARQNVRASLTSALDGPETIAALRLERRMEDLVDGHRGEELLLRKSAQRHREHFAQLSPLIDLTALAVLLFVGGRDVIAGRMTIGVLSSFLAVEILLRRPLAAAVASVLELSRVRPVLDRLDDLETAPLESHAGTEPLPATTSIDVHALTVRPAPDAPPSLSEVSLSVLPGEHVTIIGPSGSGKSTLLRALVGLVETSGGAIRMGGVDIERLDMRELRRRVAFVGCDGSFFGGTLRENLALGRDVSSASLRWALEVAFMGDAASDLDAPFSPTSYSGGQRSRLLLARALVSRPSVLLLDEITSALDQGLERALFERLRDLHLTVLSVTHRASAFRHADRLVVLERGRVAALGRFEELLESSPALWTSMGRSS